MRSCFRATSPIEATGSRLARVDGFLLLPSAGIHWVHGSFREIPSSGRTSDQPAGHTNHSQIAHHLSDSRHQRKPMPWAEGRGAEERKGRTH